MITFHGELKSRLVRYCAIDGQQNMDSPAAPSTACQHAMLDLLVTKLNHAQFEALFEGLQGCPCL